MKRYMFVVVTKDDNRLVALYQEEAPAKKLLPQLEQRLGLDLIIIKQQINKDINRIVAEFNS